jgi:hypothetical protein
MEQFETEIYRFVQWYKKWATKYKDDNYQQQWRNKGKWAWTAVHHIHTVGTMTVHEYQEPRAKLSHGKTAPVMNYEHT